LPIPDRKRPEAFEIGFREQSELAGRKRRHVRVSEIRIGYYLADSWLGRVLRHDGLLKDILEGKMSEKPLRGRIALSDLAKKTKARGTQNNSQRQERVARIEDRWKS